METTIADRMKDHITIMNNIKVKLIKNNIWSADTVVSSLKSHKDIDNIDVSESKDKLYIHMKKGNPNINSMDLDTYYSISEFTKKIINPRSNAIKNTLNDTEIKCIKDLGIDKATNMMYHLYNIPNRNIFIMDL